MILLQASFKFFFFFNFVFLFQSKQLTLGLDPLDEMVDVGSECQFRRWTLLEKKFCSMRGQDRSRIVRGQLCSK